MSVVILDQSDWGVLRMTGTDRVRFLHGMCTGDVEALAVGGWKRASMLNVKGRVVSIIDIVKRADDLLLICSPDLTEKTEQLLNRHAIMDDVELEHVRMDVHRVWSSIDAVWTAPPVFAAPPHESTETELEIRRVEAGLPKYGVDVSEDHFPFESLLGRLIDYDKGCYIGQEPVYRVHSKGSANKIMRGLIVAGDTLPEPGATVAHADRQNAGILTSAVHSPDFGTIGLAYIHRKVWDPGQNVQVGGQAARIVELPFSAAG